LENCGNTLVLWCFASGTGGTARFASPLTGERDVFREHTSQYRRLELFYQPQKLGKPKHSARDGNHCAPSEIEQLPDLVDYLKIAFKSEWLKFQFTV
jgi:hypothetical protein